MTGEVLQATGQIPAVSDGRSQVEALLDTDTLSAMMKTDPRVVPAASEYVEQHGGFTFSVITRYEILRGLFWKNAHTQAEAFDRFCSH